MQKKNKARSLAIAVLLIIGITITPPVEANHPLVVSLNGQQLKSRFEVNNGQVYAPLFSLAAELDYKVNWDRQGAKINIVTDDVNLLRRASGTKITEQQVADWIVEQGEADRYYLEGLSIELLDLDRDGESEIVAMIDGGVHLGNYFIFDRDSNGDYQLIFERNWKVDSLKLREPIEVGDKLIYETVERTGGTGLSVEIVHLWYIEQGQVVEVWKGTVKEMNAVFPGSYSLTVAGYRIQDGLLYYWRTFSPLEDDAETVQGTSETTLTIYTFDGASFIER
ncbi:hypothetical protein [Paenibacillus lentus]|uniref:Copper amine oxidase N-terminal domain-containing protein n=1 Tax=Paenibacillus lentus TaxID=1338368 RepID=A0A3S8RXG1_9BACL|nr:hypothetical protein [Paenibacillus lentus]AZK47397.1 hypothetical protein EIM92_15575 [Paenibacillus lentus]